MKSSSTPVRLLFILFVCSVHHFINAQNTETEGHITNLDSCKSSPIIPIVKSKDQIFRGGTISLNTFENLNKITLLSTCLKKEFEVRGFRLVGAVNNREPLVIYVEGDTLHKSDIAQLKTLGDQFNVFIEDIRGKNIQGTGASSISLAVR